ncbi:MAG: TRAP transporter small permease subunit [Gammaproteobacteria bacterium]|nr:TRAP transporter small permease subunit [Gammaproteobacteria bacterium]
MIDRGINRIGAAAAWLNLGMVAATCVVVGLRYAFGAGAIAMQEAVIYMHAIALSAGLAYTLQRDEHVRVDLLYARMGERGKCWVNLCGHLFLLVPTCICIIAVSLPYAVQSWSILEGSPEVGGVPAVFLLKSLLPASAALLALQGLTMAWREAQSLRGSRRPDT